MSQITNENRVNKESLWDSWTNQGQNLNHWMNGVTALMMACAIQQKRDENQGHKTQGMCSGYRGSPLGGMDQTWMKYKHHWEGKGLYFKPGVNEELAVTALWGTQQIHLHPQDVNEGLSGVFGLWYGKGPGVDRSCDALKHANMAGVAPYGGVVAVAGDDHGAKSSSIAHQSEHVLKACGIPVFFPSNVQEIIDFSIHAWALSRFSGLWAGLKTIQNIVESSHEVDLDAGRVKVNIPNDFHMPENGVHIRWPDTPLAQEERMMKTKWYAALAYIRANELNQVKVKNEHDVLGLMASGKAYNDTMQALEDLGWDGQVLQAMGVRIMKIGVVWPLEPQGVRDFARGLKEVLVIEEKRQMIEYQLKEQLYGWRPEVRPHVLGKFNDMGLMDESGGEWNDANPSGRILLNAQGELNAYEVAKAIVQRVKVLGRWDVLTQDQQKSADDWLKKQQAHENRIKKGENLQPRTPWFCSGCPHNTSTKVPQGSRALAGIGCHYMAQWMGRDTETFSQMGGEGVSWTGQAPFVKTPHVFANLGDGTYYHSGILAIRQSKVSGVNITYRILFNQAVAMTGGQAVEGGLTVQNIVQELRAEGVQWIRVVTDQVEKYEYETAFNVVHRDAYDEILEQAKHVKGVSVIIYDQPCATEKRRKEKRKEWINQMPALQTGVWIHPQICEGCGDCSKQSNCMSVEPLTTLNGTKRKINTLTCNQDMTCIKGFCPSFITLKNVTRKKEKKQDFVTLLNLKIKEESEKKEISRSSGASRKRVLLAGIGGTGIITAGHILSQAAYFNGYQSMLQECAGLAQKGGATWCHVQWGEQRPWSSLISPSQTDVLLASDVLVASQPQTLGWIHEENTKTVCNRSTHAHSQWIERGEVPAFDPHKIKSFSKQWCEADLTEMAQEVWGELGVVHLIEMGMAWAHGWLDLDWECLLKAAQEHDVHQKEKNTQALWWGRLKVQEAAWAQGVRPNTKEMPIHWMPQKKKEGDMLNEVGIQKEGWRVFLKKKINHWGGQLQQYQDLKLRMFYEQWMEQWMDRLGEWKDPQGRLTQEVALQMFRTLYVKDEFEVARLWLEAQKEKPWEKDWVVTEQTSIDYHLAPPWWNATRKTAWNARWMNAVFEGLQKAKKWRIWTQAWASQERKDEKRLHEQYTQLMDKTLNELKDESITFEQALERAQWMRGYKGFGHIKWAKHQELQTQWMNWMKSNGHELK